MLQPTLHEENANAQIKFDADTQTFHLRNHLISYIFSVAPGKILNHIYYGTAIRHYHNLRRFPKRKREFSPNLPGNPGQTDRTYSKDVLPQEYSGYLTGDFRNPAIIIRADNGSLATDFRFVDYRILDGKPDLEGLPHAYVKHNAEAKTLIVRLVDTALKAQLELTYTIYTNRPVITRSAKLTNHATKSFTIEKIASMQVDLPKQDLDVISLPGAHMRERQIERQSLRHGTVEFFSRRGTSSHHMNPFISVVDPETDEDHGQALGMLLVYSGNHKFTLEKDYLNQTRIIAGINDDDFSWELKPGTSFQAPEVIMAYSNHGLNAMSQAYHSLLRERVARGKFQYAPRPIVINNWEATYFNFDAKKITAILDAAAPLGVEMFVLDDGWFGHRDSDSCSLGDWHENRSKLKDIGGLKGLAALVHKKGMKFGLWFEPEMISQNSELFKQHPDYAFHIPGRQMNPGRDQFVLDFSRPEVVDNIFQQICHVLDATGIDYIKWDMNRNLTDVYSASLSAAQQGEVAHHYILGVYDLAERLTKRYPNILFEGCSGGGGRFDAGMLYYFPQFWASDNTDPVERLKIQYGTSLAYPPSSITAHVSASPNKQDGRNTDLHMRAAVAFSGVFGYELDPNTLDDLQKETIKTQIKFYKKHRQLLQYGDLYRLESPFDSNGAAWEFVSPDRSEALLFDFNILTTAQPTYGILKLQGLKTSASYQTNEGQIYGGDELMAAGMYDVPSVQKDFTAKITYFKQK